jgi:Flp pilus assembly pilin Flp
VSRGASSIEYGLLIAVIGALVCIGIGYSVKSLFEKTVTCFVSNLQGVSDPACEGPGAAGDGGGGGGGVVPGIAPSPSPSPSPTSTPTPSASPTSTP